MFTSQISTFVLGGFVHVQADADRRRLNLLLLLARVHGTEMGHGLKRVSASDFNKEKKKNHGLHFPLPEL